MNTLCRAGDPQGRLPHPALRTMHGTIFGSAEMASAVGDVSTAARVLAVPLMECLTCDLTSRPVRMWHRICAAVKSVQHQSDDTMCSRCGNEATVCSW